MRILFVHQNFPGQFVHLAPALKARGHDVRALTVSTNSRPSPVPVMRYTIRNRTGTIERGAPYSHFVSAARRGEDAALAAATVRDKEGYVPDVIFGHVGWGEAIYLKEVWPSARLLLYAEFFYRTDGLDVGFDPEIYPRNLAAQIKVISMQGPILLAMNAADKALAPTRFQADAFPDTLRQRIAVIHDGIDTSVVKPDPGATVSLPGRKEPFRAGDEILTFVNRNLEPYRGYHVFMRALPKVMAARPNAHVFIVGADTVSYGAAPRQGGSWKQIFLDEVKGRLDLSRVHFVGQIPYGVFLSLMQVTRVHAYLTYPFVLSWSMLESMSAGALVVGSRTGPVEEVLRDGVNGRLVDFFDVDGWSQALIEGLAEPKRFEGMRAAARQTVIDGYDLKSRCLPDLIRFVEEP